MSKPDYHNRPAPEATLEGDRQLFTKVEGTGNDFILIDERRAAHPLSVEARIALCDRHFGIGADGVLAVQATDGGLARMHVTNADGSVPEMCGNGLRCVAWWLASRDEAPRGSAFTLDTDAGPKAVVVAEDDAAVRIDMGPAQFEGVLSSGALRSGTIEHEGVALTASAVSMGNPHLVLFDALDSAVQTAGGRPERWGPTLSHHPLFPEGANIGFARQTGDTALDLVVCERGAGLTLACGTGACAAVAAHVEAGRLPADTPIAVTLPGGPLRIWVSADLRKVTMEGPARIVFEGALPAPAASEP
jgi:diaminopimelate epimerase